MTERAHFRVEGRVQGVGFRRFVERCAQKRGLSGWVRNCDDGSVEVLAGGEAEALGDFRRDVERGPPGARIAALVDLPVGSADPLPNPFSIRRT